MGQATRLLMSLALAMTLATPLVMAKPRVAPAVLADGRGRAVALLPPPRRIASCSLASDEILLELLAHAQTSVKLVAVSALASDPRFSNVVTAAHAVKGRCGDEIESLLALRPDLAILASYNRPEILARLEHAGVRTFVLGSFNSMDDIAKNIAVLGRLAHLEVGATTMLAAFRKERARLTAKVPLHGARPGVLEFFPDGSTSGAGTLFDDLVHGAGATNLAGDLGLKGWPRLDAEKLATLTPAWIIAAGSPTDRPKILAALHTLPGWREMTAAKQGHLILVPQSELAAVSPHVLAALAQLVDTFTGSKANKASKMGAK